MNLNDGLIEIKFIFSFIEYLHHILSMPLRLNSLVDIDEILGKVQYILRHSIRSIWLRMKFMILIYLSN